MSHAGADLGGGGGCIHPPPFLGPSRDIYITQAKKIPKRKDKPKRKCSKKRECWCLTAKRTLLKWKHKYDRNPYSRETRGIYYKNCINYWKILERANPNYKQILSQISISPDVTIIPSAWSRFDNSLPGILSLPRINCQGYMVHVLAGIV